jgi:hypothetical protein
VHWRSADLTASGELNFRAYTYEFERNKYFHCSIRIFCINTVTWQVMYKNTETTLIFVMLKYFILLRFPSLYIRKDTMKM